MVKKHLKQLAAPKSWPLERKGSKFVTRPDSGAHSLQTGIPMALALTNMLKVAKTTADADRVLYKQEVLVDQVRRKSPKYIVGFMDSISFPATKEAFRVLMNRKGTLIVKSIDIKESKIKLARIKGKRVLGKDRVQLNLDSGRNIIVKKDEFKVGDTLLLELPEQKIVKHIKFEPGAKVLMTSNKHMGKIGEILEVQDRGVLVKTAEETLLADKGTLFAVGKEKLEISIPE